MSLYDGSKATDAPVSAHTSASFIAVGYAAASAALSPHARGRRVPRVVAGEGAEVGEAGGRPARGE